MSVDYKGKSPNFLWYGWQHTKAFAKSFSSYGTKTEAQQGAKNTGLMAGCLVGGGMISSIGALAVVPLLPAFVSFVALYAALTFGIKAFRNFANVKNSNSHYHYIQEQEQKWLERKRKPSALSRLKNALGKKPARTADPAPTGPISQGKVFEPEAAPTSFDRKGGSSFTFNDAANSKPAANENAAPAETSKKRRWFSRKP